MTNSGQLKNYYKYFKMFMDTKSTSNDTKVPMHVDFIIPTLNPSSFHTHNRTLS
jgi:hypothetical protein